VTSDVADAFGDPGTILLLTLPTEKEEDAVLALDGRRDALLARTAPAVLFLLRGGGAEERLREDAAGLEKPLARSRRPARLRELNPEGHLCGRFPGAHNQKAFAGARAGRRGGRGAPARLRKRPLG
jgi:hypothetical protein